ncbi:conserved hypothetical protein [Rhodococcus sp. RD6.2]|jgi:hypothetical protein|nr:conserved hypothetical protein [Rhodococcus sp. RD6.2]
MVGTSSVAPRCTTPPVPAPDGSSVADHPIRTEDIHVTHSHPRQNWTVERVVPLMGGVMILLSVALAVGLSPWWLVLTGFVGANLVFYSAVGWCPASLLMERAGLPRASCRVRNRPDEGNPRPA